MMKFLSPVAQEYSVEGSEKAKYEGKNLTEYSKKWLEEKLCTALFFESVLFPLIY